MGKMAVKCAHPDCQYTVHSDKYVSENYCCGKCEGMAAGEEWAFEGKKRHWKNCEHHEFGKLFEKFEKPAKWSAADYDSANSGKKKGGWNNSNGNWNDGTTEVVGLLWDMISWYGGGGYGKGKG